MAHVNVGNNEAPVFLLTVPGTNEQNDLLVASYKQGIYRLHLDPGSSWSSTQIGSASVPSGFKQLALAMDEGQTNPDLVIRTGKNLFLEPAAPSIQGTVDVHRTGAKYTFNDIPSQASSSGLVWVTPFRFAGAAGDSLAVTWDDSSTVQRRSAEFFYVTNVFTTNSQGFSPQVYTSGATFFPELQKPFRSTALLHTPQKNSALLFVLSQVPNYLGVLSGDSVPGLALDAQAQVTPGGLLQPYTGDMNGDGQDEIGFYAMALNSNALTRHLQLLSYKNKMIGTSKPIVDISSDTENFRAMSLAFLGPASDRRRLAGRKDLLVLAEDPAVGGSSRLRIFRANLNYVFP